MGHPLKPSAVFKHEGTFAKALLRFLWPSPFGVPSRGGKAGAAVGAIARVNVGGLFATGGLKEIP
ncbi:MAG: hypothetical protein LBQ12_12540 [Deltaproteobacteria bacterium]|jgi:hypothetical protein|nr:hypothetical protein [Deltaproteobacteria bacterium]